MKTIFWDRRPGNFVKRDSGELAFSSSLYNGSIQDWYYTLYEILKLINCDKIIVSREINTILECCPNYIVNLNDKEYNDGKLGQISNIQIFHNEKQKTSIISCYKNNEEVAQVKILGLPDWW
jgi:hypothetical protein